METHAQTRPVSNALRRIGCISLALFAAVPILACENAAALRWSRHLQLGVRFSTHDPRIVEQMSRALDRWSEITDMSWHRDDGQTCSIDIEDGKFIGEDEIAEARAQDGSVTFASVGELTAEEVFIAAFHEIGHLLGLQHNPSPRSVMYWIDIRGDEVLDGSDMRALATMHLLRADSSCSARGHCEILSRRSEGRRFRNEKPTSEVALAESSKDR